MGDRAEQLLRRIEELQEAYIRERVLEAVEDLVEHEPQRRHWSAKTVAAELSESELGGLRLVTVREALEALSRDGGPLVHTQGRGYGPRGVPIGNPVPTRSGVRSEDRRRR